LCIADLEKEAATSGKKEKYTLSKNEKKFLTMLIVKYGEEYKVTIVVL
jgi:hypothetical protein